jgi:large subunit ribosomal protein L6
MSRIGKKGIVIPEKTEVVVNNGVVSVKGPKGAMERSFRPDVNIAVIEKEVVLTISKSNQQLNALWGTYASHIKNMIKGVNEGFEKKLILEGVGFKSQVAGDKLVLALGFSHPVEVEIPAGLAVKAEKNVISVSGIDKELVGAWTSKVRSLKEPEPYKGKGFHYSDEVVRRKQGKKSV